MSSTLLTTVLAAILFGYTEASTLKCDPGQYRDVTRTSYRRRRSGGRIRTSCKSCTPGHYMDLYGHREELCWKCPSKLWTDAVGAISCKGTGACAGGSWGPLAMTSPGVKCTLCEAGKVQPHVGSGSCHTCSSGTYATGVGKTTCMEAVVGGCPAGKFGTMGSTTVAEASCISCPADTYSSNPGESECKACSKGQHQPKTGGTACIEHVRCSRGKTWDMATRTCVTRHRYLEILQAVAWATWVLNYFTCCTGHLDERMRERYAPAMVLNVFTGFGIGIETTRYGGPIGEPAFWTMVGFQGIGTVALVLYLVCLIWKSLPKCTAFKPSTYTSHSGKHASGKQASGKDMFAVATDKHIETVV